MVHQRQSVRKIESQFHNGLEAIAYQALYFEDGPDRSRQLENLVDSIDSSALACGVSGTVSPSTWRS